MWHFCFLGKPDHSKQLQKDVCSFIPHHMEKPHVSVVLMVGVATVLIPPMKIEDDAATGGPLEPGFSWHGQKQKTSFQAIGPGEFRLNP